MNNSQVGAPGWMMMLACLLVAAIISGMLDNGGSMREDDRNGTRTTDGSQYVSR